MDGKTTAHTIMTKIKLSIDKSNQAALSVEAR